MADWEIEDGDDLGRDLYKFTMTGEWRQVVDMYRENTNDAPKTTINKLGDTALHVAVSMAPDSIVEQLVRIISDFRGDHSILRSKNNEGNTPLHVAASSGRFYICFLLANADPFSRYVPNNLGESPLFLATFHGHKAIFLRLKNLKADPDPPDCVPNPHLHPLPQPDPSLQTTNPYVRKDDETILHCAIRWEYLDLAYDILKKKLIDRANRPNSEGITPLHLLAIKPSVFRSGCYLGWRKNIIYYCTHVHEADFLKDVQNNLNFPKNDETFIDFFEVGLQARSDYPEYQFFQRCHAKCFDKIYLLFKILIRVIFGVEYEAIKKLKQKHIYSDKIMKFLIQCSKTGSIAIHMNSDFATPAGTDNENKRTETGDPDSSRSRAVDSDCDGMFGKGKTPGRQKTETSIVLAARNGITEIIKEILTEFPMSIHDKSEGKNIVLLAVENRQPHVLQLLLKQKIKDKLIHEMDTEGNNALHLAAKLGHHKPWQIPGAALQMQWEIKWYAFVKKNMPEHFSYQLNKVKDKKEEKNQTPDEIFNNTHEALVEQGGRWLIKTSESYSVVAALVATVAFATSTTIPGEFNDNTGIPNLEKKPGLTIFAISSLIALCSSITALFSFLAIHTSRYQKKEFYRDLPMKLLFGLTSLFVSITSMLVSFCAGHFFTLENKLRGKAFPIYAVTLLPIIFFAIAQFQLYFEILMATFKKMPHASHKAISL